MICASTLLMFTFFKIFFIFIQLVVRNQFIVAGAAVQILTCTLADLFGGISSPWCFSERSAVGVPYKCCLIVT